MAEFFSNAALLYLQCQISLHALVTASSPNKDADTIRCQVGWEQYRLGLWGESAKIPAAETKDIQIPSSLEALDWKLIAHTLQILNTVLSDSRRLRKRYHLELSLDPDGETADASSTESASSRLTRLFKTPAYVTQISAAGQTSNATKSITYLPRSKPQIATFLLDIATLNSHLLSLLPGTSQIAISALPIRLLQSAFINAKDALDLEIIRQNLDISRRDRSAAATQRRSTLMKAIEKDDMFSAELCIACGVKVDGDEWNGRENPLMVALKWNCLRIAKLLVSFGADPNASGISSISGLTPLHHAARSASSEVVSWLLSLSTPASKTSTDMHGRNAVFHASAYDNTDALSVLLSDPVLKRLETADNNGCTALWTAASNEHHRSLRMLLDAYPEDLNICYAGDGPPLVGAVRGEAQECVRILLQQKDIEVDGVDSEGKSALHHAATRNRYIMDQLRAAGADVGLQDKNGMTCLAVAVDKGCVAETRHLLTWAEVEFNAVGKRGSALCIAANTDEAELAGMLLRAGADVEGCDVRGRTALIIAAEAGHEGMVRLLCRYEANKERMDKRGFTAAEWAKVGKKEGILRVLEGL